MNHLYLELHGLVSSFEAAFPLTPMGEQENNARPESTLVPLQGVSSSCLAYGVIKNISYQDSVYLVKLFPSSKSDENAEIGKFQSSADSTSNQKHNEGNGLSLFVSM